jgi:hypothetical protein
MAVTAGVKESRSWISIKRGAQDELIGQGEALSVDELYRCEHVEAGLL